MYLKLFFAHVCKCETSNKKARGLVHESGKFIENRLEAKSWEAGCMAQSSETNCDCHLLNTADLMRNFAGQVIAMAIALHVLSDDGVQYSVILYSSCGSFYTVCIVACTLSSSSGSRGFAMFQKPYSCSLYMSKTLSMSKIKATPHSPTTKALRKALPLHTYGLPKIPKPISSLWHPLPYFIVTLPCLFRQCRSLINKSYLDTTNHWMVAFTWVCQSGTRHTQRETAFSNQMQHLEPNQSMNLPLSNTAVLWNTL